ncbi:MAG: rod shape-determining protein MreD [Candidatus Solibacter usitatus]|nr:rod shape-determining protein MreD [Candidatus Solibacter usitatus]
MSDFNDRVIVTGKPRGTISKYQPLVLFLTPLLAILFQIYVPRFVAYLAFLDLPLLVTIYFAFMRRSPIAGLFLGAGIGLVQDALSDQPLGMFGIVKTLVGYLAAGFSQRFASETAMLRIGVAFAFYLGHQFLYWTLQRALLGLPVSFDPGRVLLLGVLNALVAAPLFLLLDKLRDRG